MLHGAGQVCVRCGQVITAVLDVRGGAGGVLGRGVGCATPSGTLTPASA